MIPLFVNFRSFCKHFSTGHILQIFEEKRAKGSFEDMGNFVAHF